MYMHHEPTFYNRRTGSSLRWEDVHIARCIQDMGMNYFPFVNTVFFWVLHFDFLMFVFYFLEPF